jgi:type I restriction enzyme S subunit
MSACPPTVGLDALVELRPEKVASNKDPSLRYIGLEHIAQGQPHLLGSLPSSASVSINSCFSKDDILFGKLRPNLRKSLKAPFSGYCSTDILVLRARNGVLPQYAAHVFQWERVFAAASATGVGTKMPRTSWNDLKRHWVFKPSSEIEQSRIATVLDTVDDAIAKTEAVIAKLRQVRAGLLHDLLTRGLDHNGQLRDPIAHPEQFQDSPLGQLPKDWDICLLDDVALRGSGHTPTKDVPSCWDGGIKWVSLADSDKLDRIYISETDKQISELGIENSSAVKHSAGTVILSRDAGIGKSAILAEEMAVSQHFMAWRCGKRLYNLFLYYWLQHNKPQFEAIAMGSTIKTIGLPYFKRLKIAVPPSEEQRTAANAMLASEATIASEEVELRKLQQLKSGLMTDLLTGRVRVPEGVV